MERRRERMGSPLQEARCQPRSSAIIPTSFRKDLLPIPPRYRTPSPPRDAFEPLSPILNTEGATVENLDLQCAENPRIRNGLKRNYSTSLEEASSPSQQTHVSGAAIDAFASTVLATKSNRLHQPTESTADTQPLIGHCNQKPSKRARSEKLPSPEWPRKRVGADSRPATSYEQSPEDRRLEAELLLNFAQAAAKLIPPSPVLRHARLPHAQVTAEKRKHGRLESYGYGQMKQGQQHISREPHTTDDTTGEPEVQILPQSCAATDDKLRTEEDGSTQHIVTPPPVAISVADNSPDTREVSRTSLEATMPLTSKDDEVDLIRDSSGSGQGVAATQTAIPDNTEAQTNPAASSPRVKPRCDLSSSEQSILGNDSQAPTDTTLLFDDTLQSLDNAIQVMESDASLKGEPIEEANPREVQQLPKEDVENDSGAIHAALGNYDHTVNESPSMTLEAAVSPIHEVHGVTFSDSSEGIYDTQSQLKIATAVCEACSLTRNWNAVETENNSTSWISCDACKSWFHFACAGFKNEREVRSVDKFRCRKCKPVYGPTTYVRKSSRAHSAIDYAGLHQGVIKTSDERPEHHYIKPIKEGTITFLPENFPRMRPELVTAEYFEKGTGMKEPVVIPACFNPRPKGSSDSGTENRGQDGRGSPPGPLEDDDATEEWFSYHPESESVSDYGQDALDMVIPQGLTVRQVAELYGPDEKVEVIDVKSQNGENKKWNMRRWADYYENPNNKVVRNVISLEVSQSKLGRLIRRPQIVRDLDLQDSVWPEDLLAKGEYPRVQFYTLMSVADCFTDFHIDFGGSSVFYHILKGKKTFLFIPPKEKYLKKYEEWCMSPAQNWTFLGDQTKECYRVDLSEGDTMLIPSGWIHAVWTPEDSLVIGGNFLTRMNFGMQLRVAQVEKATGVARKFRYPHFQKLHWYTALRYLETDPLPDSVRDVLHGGGSFHREQATYYEFDGWGGNSQAGPENYHARYYSQPELEGLPDLTRYLLRTALIDIGSITDGISADTRNAMKKSIPRGHGEPLDVMKTFAAWCAWKRGNEPIPHWAYPDAVPENSSPDKLSAAATKKLDREAALSAPRRQSARMQHQQEALEMAPLKDQAPSSLSNSLAASEAKRSSSVTSQGPAAAVLKKSRVVSGTGTSSHRKTACESCRKRRRACKHKDEVASSIMATPTANMIGSATTALQLMSPNPAPPLDSGTDDLLYTSNMGGSSEAPSASNDGIRILVPEQSTSPQPRPHTLALPQELIAPSQSNTTTQEPGSEVPIVDLRMPRDAITTLENGPGYTMLARPRHKACNECRKSKVSINLKGCRPAWLILLQRRCIHDAFGNEDPVKVRETAIPRPHARKSNAQGKDDHTNNPTKSKHGGARQTNTLGLAMNAPASHVQVGRMAPVANMIAPPTSFEPQMDGVANLPDAIMQRKIAESASLLIDPALFLDDTSSFHQEKRTMRRSSVPQPTGQKEEPQQSAAAQRPEQSEDPIHVDTSYTAPDVKVGPVQLEPKESFEQPAGSLVSPPASSHDDAGNSPTVAKAQWTPSRSSSEQSGEEPKQMQRYTPESGPVRRASSSSDSEIALEKIPAPRLTEQPSGQNPRPGPNPDFLADHESLRLIKELQAQELGLRRRGKA